MNAEPREQTPFPAAAPPLRIEIQFDSGGQSELAMHTLTSEPEMSRICRREHFIAVLRALPAAAVTTVAIRWFIGRAEPDAAAFGWVVGGCIAVLVLLVGGTHGGAWVRFRRDLWKKSAVPVGPSRPLTLVLDADGVEMSDDSHSTRLKWVHFDRVVELPNYVALTFVHEHAPIGVPRSSFATPEVFAAFVATARALLAASGQGGDALVRASLATNSIPCARCGHDLRGLREPKCPECGRELTALSLRLFAALQQPWWKQLFQWRTTESSQSAVA